MASCKSTVTQRIINISENMRQYKKEDIPESKTGTSSFKIQYCFRPSFFRRPVHNRRCRSLETCLHGLLLQWKRRFFRQFPDRFYGFLTWQRLQNAVKETKAHLRYINLRKNCNIHFCLSDRELHRKESPRLRFIVFY